MFPTPDFSLSVERGRVLWAACICRVMIVSLRTLYLFAVVMSGAAAVPFLPAKANDSDAHSLADKFAGAHEPKSPAKATGPQNPGVTQTRETAAGKVVDGELTSDDVRDAFEQRKQDSDLKQHEALIESIEERTKAIERLLDQTDDASWQSDVIVAPEPAKDRVTLPEADQAAAPSASDEAEAAGLDATTSTDTALGVGKTLGVETADDRSEGLAVPKLSGSDAPKPDDERREIERPAYALGGPRNVVREVSKAASLGGRATVLLLIEPGNKGIRRFKKTADPVICSRFDCYRSQGPGRSAVKLSRGDTLGPFNTLGLRAGACRSKLACAFRDVEIEDTGTTLQPVDLKLMKHDRREQLAVAPDKSCEIVVGRLYCSNPVVSKTWRAWIIPEDVAEQAGSEALEAALEEGLSDAPPQAVVSAPSDE